MPTRGFSPAACIVPAILWLWLFFHLHYEWSLNPQYGYGWAVPFLAGFMFYLRWPSRPAVTDTAPSAAASLCSWILLALLLPIRVIEEANPDWRLLSWVFALVVVAYLLLALAHSVGPARAWHFAFPICFTLVAVPWLVRFENVVIQALTHAVAFAGVEIAGWVGVGAYQIGNVIELHNGFVGVDEACSGVKTLQASIMVSLVVGELFQVRPWRRGTLLVLGAVWVFACNVLRAATLVIIAARQGTSLMERWHDSIGTAVLILGMAGLVAIGWSLRNRQLTETEASESTATKDRAYVSTRWISPALAVVWLITIFAGTELWYRSQERALVNMPSWRGRWPAENPTMRSMPVADTTRAILRYDDASSAAWEDPRGILWWSFFARWEPQRTALQLVRSHSPEICLPAVGRRFVAERPPIIVETQAAPLRFRAYEFEQSNRPLFVFVCIQEDKVQGSPVATAAAQWNARGRLAAAWHGQRNLGQRLLEIAVTGFEDFPRARAEVERAVREIVVGSAITG